MHLTKAIAIIFILLFLISDIALAQANLDGSSSQIKGIAKQIGDTLVKLAQNLWKKISPIAPGIFNWTKNIWTEYIWKNFDFYFGKEFRKEGKETLESLKELPQILSQFWNRVKSFGK